MKQEARKIKDFTDLVAWQKGHALVLEIYQITKFFPKEEQFGLSNQVRRAVVSITSNIAEGFSRMSMPDKSKFYTIALGSTTEVQNQLLIARDIKYISHEVFEKINEELVELNKIINGLIKRSRTLILAS